MTIRARLSRARVSYNGNRGRDVRVCTTNSLDFARAPVSVLPLSARPRARATVEVLNISPKNFQTLGHVSYQTRFYGVAPSKIRSTFGARARPSSPSLFKYSVDENAKESTEMFAKERRRDADPKARIKDF